MIKYIDRKKDKKREAILNSALMLFSEKGFQKTKVSEIARSASVADGTVYLYYKNKDVLFMAVFNNLIFSKLIDLKAMIEPIEDELERLFTFFQLHTDWCLHNPQIARFIVLELRQSFEFFDKYPD